MIFLSNADHFRIQHGSVGNFMKKLIDRIVLQDMVTTILYGDKPTQAQREEVAWSLNNPPQGPLQQQLRDRYGRDSRP